MRKTGTRFCGLAVAVMAAALAPAPTTGAGEAAGAAKINGPAANTAFTDLRGGRHTLTGQDAPAVYLFLSTQCPVSGLYAPRIAALERAYRARGARFFGVFVQPHDAQADLALYARQRGFGFPLTRNAALAARLGATVTPQAVVLDRAGVARYRGRIDDNKDSSRVSAPDLRRALDAVLAGKAVAKPETTAFGCALSPAPARPVPNALVTYARSVAPVLNAACVPCHRSGEAAPFPLETYAQARAWAKQIKISTGAGRMPPWNAAPRGVFHDERTLTKAQRAALAAWADAGAPLGDLAELPPPPRFLSRKPGGWKLGEPDAVFEMPETYQVAPDGRDVYRCFVVPTEFADKWVSAVEVLPGNRNVVHHVVAYLDKTGKARELDAKDPGPGYTNPTPGNPPGFVPAGALAAWVPGQEPRALPEGVGNLMPARSDVVIEVHYHPNGKSEADKTRIGVTFAKGPVRKKLTGGVLVNRVFRIPPGARDHVVRASSRILQNVTVLAVGPHMHTLGKSARVTATLPDGTKRALVDVPRYDFDWQFAYWYKTPIKLPKGTRLDLEVRYDNSARNPDNPSRPPRPVVWGEQTTDEMCLAGLVWTLDAEDLTTPNPQTAGTDSVPN